MTLEFRNRKDEFITEWRDWCGEIPQKDDTVLIFKDDNDPVGSWYGVDYRKISGRQPDRITVILLA